MSNKNQTQPIYLNLMRGGRMAKIKGVAASIAPMLGAAVLSTGLSLVAVGPVAAQSVAQTECGTVSDGPNAATIICNGIAGDAGSDGSVNVTVSSDTNDDAAGLAGGLTIDLTTPPAPAGTLETLAVILDGRAPALTVGDPLIGRGVSVVNKLSSNQTDLTIRTLGEVAILGSSSGFIGGFYDGGGTITFNLSDGTLIQATSLGSNGDGIRLIRRTPGASGDIFFTNAGTILSTGERAVQAIQLENQEALGGDIFVVTTDSSYIETTRTGASLGSLDTGIYVRQWSTDPAANGNIEITAGGTIITGQANSNRDITRTDGIFARMDGGGSTIITSTAEITTYGTGSSGITGLVNGTGNAEGVTIEVRDGTISTLGANSVGVYGLVSSPTATGNSVVDITGGSVLASGAGSYGVASWSVGGSSSLSVDTLVTGGSGSGGGLFGGAASDGTSTIDIGANGNISAYSDIAVVANGGAATVNNDGTILGAVFLTDENDTFTNNSSTSWNIRNFADTTGDLIRDTEAVAVSDFGAGVDTYTNTATGALRLVTVEDMAGFTSVTDDDTAPETWDMTGQYFAPGSAALSIETAGVEQAQLFNLEFFNHAGLIAMADVDTGGLGPVAGDVLLITGGSAPGTSAGGVFTSNGGQLHIDTILNDGVIDITDVLVVDNAVLGSAATSITVTNALSGAGASTDLNGNGIFDVDEGILVVQVLEAGEEGAFLLSGPLMDGAWQYVLDQTDGLSWYLHSTFNNMVPIYEAFPMALQGLQTMPSLQQRVGNRHWAGEPSPSAIASEFVFCKDPAQNFSCAVTPGQAQVFADAPTGALIEGSGAWVRVDGSRADYMPENSSASISVDESIGSIEAGIDRLLHESEDGDRVIGGISFRYARSGVDVSSAFGDGSIDTGGFGIGAALTWYDTEGLYVDAQARALWTSSDLTSTAIGTLAEDVDGFGYGLSVEVGKEVALSETWNVTPQAQLSYSNVKADDFTGPFATVTDLENESLALRAGVVASNEVDWQAEDGTTSRRAVNVGVHVTKEFRPESEVAVSGTPVTSEKDDLTAEITLGGTYNWNNDKYSVYGQVSAATGLDNFGDSTRVGATAGARIQWE